VTDRPPAPASRPDSDEEPIDPIAPQEISLARRVLNWKTIGSAIFAVVLLALAFRTLGVNLGRTWSLIVQANLGFLLLAFVAYYLTFPVRGYRWKYILDKVGTRVGFRDATEILLLSWFVNCLVPAKLGDLYRAYLLRGNFGASISRTVGTIFLERITDVVVIFGLALAAGFWSFRNRNNPQVDTLFLAGFVVAAALVLFLVLLRFQGHRVARFLPTKVADLWERFHEGSTGALKPMLLLQVVLITGAVWILEGVRVYFVIRSLDLQAMDLPALNLGISSTIFVALAASLLTVVPLTPAGIGFVQAGIVGVLTLYGVSTEAGTAVAITDFLLSTLSVIVIGGVVYAFSGMVRRAHGVSSGKPTPA
jgi:uncharacterized protein (TIRG00374 family)